LKMENHYAEREAKKAKTIISPHTHTHTHTHTRGYNCFYLFWI